MLYRFGACELDEEARALRHAGRPVEVQPKVLQLLLYLVRNRERVVPKEELLAALWPDEAVTDSSLTRAVSLARQAIGEQAPGRAIVNLPRLGYRFHDPVEAVAGATIQAATSRYVGRERIRQRLEASLDAALAGAGRILWLAGESGIGKTRTAALLAERARTRGALVAVARGSEPHEAPQRPWSALLRGVAAAAPRALAALPPVQRADLAGLLSGETDVRPTSAAAQATRLVEAVDAFLDRASAHRPLALLLDDLHAADGESLRLLDSIARDLGAKRVAIVVTCREDELARSEPRVQALERLLRAPRLERWSLTGLQGGEIRELARQTLGREPDPELVVALARQTGGNPLLLEESARSLVARDLLGPARAVGEWEELLPVGVRHLLAPKLRLLAPRVLDWLACAAVFGLEAPLELLSRSSAGDGLECLLVCEAAGILSANVDRTRARFPHELVRQAVAAELAAPGERRRAVHARLATALEEAGDASETLAARAYHACEAAPCISPKHAVALAEAAACEAARRLEFERAAAWSERALDVLDRAADGDPETRIRLLLALGAAQTQTSGLERARASWRRASDQARAIGRRDLFARAALGFAHRPDASGTGDPEVVEILEEALRLLPDDSALPILLRSRLAAEIRYAEPERAGTLMADVLEAARGLGDPSVLARALDDCSFVRRSYADPEGWLVLNAEIVRAARGAGDLELELRGHKGRCTGFLELGDVCALDREQRALARTAAALRTPYARWLERSLRAARALLDGDLALAERHIVESAECGARSDSPEVALELQAQLVYQRFEQGLAGEMLAPAREQAGRFPGAPAWRAALARMLLATDRRAEAADELAALARNGFGDVPEDRGLLPTLALAAEVASEVGDPRCTAALRARLAPHFQLAVVAGSGLLYYGPVAHHLGLLAAAEQDWDAAVHSFDAALAAEAAAGARLWEARTRVARARALQGRARPGDREQALRAAADVVESAAASGWVAVAREARAQ